MPDLNLLVTLPYEETASETAILLAREYLVDAVNDALDCEDRAFLNFLALDQFAIRDPEHPVIEEAEHILLGGHWSDSFSDPVQEQPFGAEAWI